MQGMPIFRYYLPLAVSPFIGIESNNYIYQCVRVKNRDLIKTQLQLPVDEFPFLNGGYATSSFAIISPNRKES